MEPPEYLEEVLEHIVSSEKDKTVKEQGRKMLEQLRKHDVVFLLKKGLYGLPQAGRAWNERLDEELRKLGAVSSDADPCVYVIRNPDLTSYHRLCRRPHNYVVE